MSEKGNAKIAKVFFFLYSDFHSRSSVDLFFVLFLFASLQRKGKKIVL